MAPSNPHRCFRVRAPSPCYLRTSSHAILGFSYGASSNFRDCNNARPSSDIELSCRIRFPIMFSCNGLALCLREDGYRGKAPFIFNPATKCAFNLPRFFIGAPLLNRLGIACAAASMSYKVVGSYHKFGLAHCGILTVGVDNSWRHVAAEGLTPEVRWGLMSCPLVTRGFVHWVSETHVVSLNVETEIFIVTPNPALMFPPDYQKSKYGYISSSVNGEVSISICFLWRLVVGSLGDETGNMGMEKAAAQSRLRSS